MDWGLMLAQVPMGMVVCNLPSSFPSCGCVIDTHVRIVPQWGMLLLFTFQDHAHYRVQREEMPVL